MRIKTLITIGFVVFVLLRTPAQTSETPDSAQVVDGVQMLITEAGLIKPGVPNLHVTFRNVGDRDVNINLGEIGGWSSRPCRLDNHDISCTLYFKLNVTDRTGQTRSYTFRGMVYVASHIGPYIMYLRAHSTYTLELGVDQFWAPETRDYRPLSLARGAYKLSLEFDGSAPGIANLELPTPVKMILWEGNLTSNPLSIQIARHATEQVVGRERR